MQQQRQKGFTLVEMAIVLVIIGIILAAVMKGRDLIHSAHETEAMQGFFLKWTTMTNDYYKGNGWPLDDGERNGGIVGDTPDGWMDGAFLEGAITSDDYQPIAHALNNAGLNACFVVKSSDWTLDFPDPNMNCADLMNPYQTYVDDEYAGKRIQSHVAFGNFFLENWENFDVVQRKNVLVFYNVPYDYALRFDTQVDGRTGGMMGRVVNMTEGNQELHDTAALPDMSGSVGNPLSPVDVQEWPLASNVDDRSRLYIVGYVLDYDVN